MPSKLVTDRKKVATLLVASEHDNEERAATLLAESFGIPVEVTKEFLRGAANKVESSVAAMVAADHAHQVELTDDNRSRVERDEAAEELQGSTIALRDIVTAAFGEAATRELGFAGRTPADPVQLHSLGSLIVKKLAVWTLPETSQLEGYVFRKESWIQKLTEPLSRLETALADIAREKREGEATLVAKNRAIDECDRATAFAANILSSTLEAIGETELAQRVRPSKRRAGHALEPSLTAANETDAEPSPTNG